MFNHNIVARELGLKEQTDITSQGEKIQNVAPPQTINIHPVVVAGAPPISEDNETEA